MSKSSISYLDYAVNCVVGCTPISPGCAHCWSKQLHDQRHAAYMAGAKLPNQYAEPFGTVRLFPERLAEIGRIRKPSVIGICFTSDLFHNDVPQSVVESVMSAASLNQRHQFIFLTKRADRMRNTMSGFSVRPNVWCAFTAEDQQRFDERWQHVRHLALAGWETWCSAEPLLGPIVSGEWPDMTIIGGESGAEVRRCDVEWIRSIVGQCREFGTRVAVKQLGSISDDDGTWTHSRSGSDHTWWPDDLRPLACSPAIWRTE